MTEKEEGVRNKWSAYWPKLQHYLTKVWRINTPRSRIDNNTKMDVTETWCE
jgi:hypothetical protein